MRFGDLAYVDKPKHIEEDELYEDEDTTPEETDEFELDWAKKKLKKAWGEHHEDKAQKASQHN